ncbi:hypothetical protein Taro_051717 [Colocasia esculenta]|uniref:Uncharacterized protein n=1 Tax=Colocasia esculenta TaxID=4460 RepID=A0A843XHJ9_COLES|nr:hypothetical protein [Colocasia esculenta]
MWLPDLAVCPGSRVVLFVDPRPCGGLRVSAALAGEGLGLVITGVLSDGFAEAAVAPCVVNSSESECCELLYLIIRIQYISHETISSNPSGSSDPWVATQTSGSLAGVREVGSLHFSSKSSSWKDRRQKAIGDTWRIIFVSGGGPSAIVGSAVQLACE